MQYDLAIVGGGPGGVAAGVYAARKQLHTIFITKDFGGQSVVSEGIENWIGTVKVSGLEFAEMLKKHLLAYSSNMIHLVDGEGVEKVDKKEGGFVIKTDGGEYEAKTILITTGSHRRKLTVPGAAKYENRGISYCASCDGPLFAGKDVVVIGGGNAAFESAAQLLNYCKIVTLIHRRDTFKADEITVGKVLSHPKMRVAKNAELIEIKGDKFPTSIIYRDKGTNEVRVVPAEGVFVEIGSVPTTEFVSHIVKLDQYDHIIVDPRTQRTSEQGIWAAGDCTDGLYRQNNIAAGDAIKSLEDIYLYLHADRK